MALRVVDPVEPAGEAKLSFAEAAGMRKLS
jgi:hypothetical protein